MADSIRPMHVPHEQLRTEAPKQKKHSDKYVTAIVGGEAQVDMSFTTPVLQKSADHFKVGIDELTVNLGNLSLLEYGEGEVLFRVIRRGYQIQNAATGGIGEVHNVAFANSIITPFLMPNGPTAATINKWRDACEFKVTRPYNTLVEVFERFRQVSTGINEYYKEHGFQNAAQVGGNPNLWAMPAVAAAQPICFFSTTFNGTVRFSGSKLFWANFVIHIPLQKYREIFFRDANREFISTHPISGVINNNLLFPPYETTPGDAAAVPPVLPTIGNITLDPVFDQGTIVTDDDLHQFRAINYEGTGNLFVSLDRRVTLEVGCSLPLKNSPMIDHGVEAPDFVLGRYMMHIPYEMNVRPETAASSNAGIPDIRVRGVGTRTMQGPRDRVVYHHLQPQQKIQLMRLRLWARVRSYDTGTKKWSMKTIVCPVQNEDYWHIRLHFIEK